MQGNQFAVQVQREGTVWAWKVVDGEGRATRTGRADTPQDAQRAAMQGTGEPVRLRSLLRIKANA